ncbi:hypothetical protein HOLleu_10964 [Holothuria leucospilota]|uniref:Uncharacterized protein n=1 Tax=Holothuria leucospilota TaxID=206669 RepID=A0A9Q1CF11_HOLLE|nr:hypothetical protein HOLleu_10964 [Holothuria leucospilota]
MAADAVFNTLTRHRTTLEAHCPWPWLNVNARLKAWDTFDLNIVPVNGKDTFHATVGKAYQNAIPVDIRVEYSELA